MSPDLFVTDLPGRSLAVDPTWSPSEQIIILHVQAPWILLAACVGAAVAVAGSIFQALLLSPLADPDQLGILGGGTAGAVLATAVGLKSIGVGLRPLLLAAFAGALLTIFLAYQVA